MLKRNLLLILKLECDVTRQAWSFPQEFRRLISTESVSNCWSSSVWTWMFTSVARRSSVVNHRFDTFLLHVYTERFTDLSLCSKLLKVFKQFIFAFKQWKSNFLNSSYSSIWRIRRIYIKLKLEFRNRAWINFFVKNKNFSLKSRREEENVHKIIILLLWRDFGVWSSISMISRQREFFSISVDGSFLKRFVNHL